MEMSEIALYNALTKLGLNHDEAKEAVADVASSKDLATKTDIIELKAETESRYQRYGNQGRYSRAKGGGKDGNSGSKGRHTRDTN